MQWFSFHAQEMLHENVSWCVSVALVTDICLWGFSGCSSHKDPELRSALSGHIFIKVSPLTPYSSYSTTNDKETAISSRLLQGIVWDGEGICGQSWEGLWEKQWEYGGSWCNHPQSESVMPHLMTALSVITQHINLFINATPFPLFSVRSVRIWTRSWTPSCTRSIWRRRPWRPQPSPRHPSWRRRWRRKSWRKRRIWVKSL